MGDLWRSIQVSIGGADLAVPLAQLDPLWPHGGLPSLLDGHVRPQPLLGLLAAGNGLIALLLGLLAVSTLSRKFISNTRRDSASRTLRADAVESIACGWLSLVVVIGLTADFLLDAWLVDPVASLGILWSVIREGREAWAGMPAATERSSSHIGGSMVCSTCCTLFRSLNGSSASSPAMSMTSGPPPGV